jgi:hypothetical protein
MNASSSHRLFLFLGPMLGASLVALSVLGNSGPGFLFSLVALVGLGVAAPILQLLLLRSERFTRRPGLASLIAIAAVVLSMLAIGTTAVFNQW